MTWSGGLKPLQTKPLPLHLPNYYYLYTLKTKMMLQLQVEIESNSGFCFGVRKAIKKAEAVLSNGEELLSLGEIVHNDEEIKRLETKGMVTISKEQFKNILHKTVLFRAHGEPPESYEIARLNHITVIDASCPIILKLQEKISQSFKSNENIYIFGVPNHPEIVALNGKIQNSAVVFEKFEDLQLSKIPHNITLYSQTTKSLRQFYEIIEKLRKNGIKVHVVDSICRQVSNREQELKEFCIRFDAIVFVAGRNSSNGKQLYEICRLANKNIRFVSNAEEIDSKWFGANQKIGICGATSTPLWLIENVKGYLLSL
jgi:4-hydroxy-3-methylbut-2-en-1-yl diphosphate reductase